MPARRPAAITMQSYYPEIQARVQVARAMTATNNEQRSAGFETAAPDEMYPTGPISPTSTKLRWTRDEAECRPYFGFRTHGGDCGPGLHFFLYLNICFLVILFAVASRFGTRSGPGKTKFLKRHSRIIIVMASLGPLAILLATGLLSGLALGQPAHPPSPSVGVIPVSTTSTADKPQITIPAGADDGLNIIPNIRDDEAKDPQDVCPGYKAIHVYEDDDGFTADLRLAGPACNVYGNDVEQLTFLVRRQSEDRLRIQIEPRYIGRDNATWFRLPEAMVPRPPDGRGTYKSDSNLDASWTNEPSFAFTVRRKDTGDVLFTSEGRALVFEDQFIEFGSSLPKNYNLYGLGESVHPLRLGNNASRTLWAADQIAQPEVNIYGAHPVYLDTRYFTKDKLGKLTYVANATDARAEYFSYTHGVFLRNAHGQEALLRPEGITWRTIGGSIDLYIFAGPTAEAVMKDYQRSATGLPAMQQYWTMGFHQCRWGYQNWSVAQGVVDDFAKFELPLETFWLDIDYMDRKRDFTHDPEQFGYADGAKFLSKLHENGQHFVPIVDAAIYAPNPENPSDAYPIFDRGVEANAFMLNPNGSLYYGAVWPGYTVFPDFVGAVLNGTGTIDWWKDEIHRYSKNVAFDGIWIDMSEVASFCVGSCGTGRLTTNPVHPAFILPGEPGNLVLDYPEGFEFTNKTEAAENQARRIQQNKENEKKNVKREKPLSPTEPKPYRTTPTPGTRNVNWPPYTINNVHGDLAVHGLSPNATHHGGAVNYDFHNLYGHQLLSATYHALRDVFKEKRPFIIGRSTFSGSGKWAGHWGGDNDSKWSSMALSIAHVLSFQIFGIPFVGTDTCGFNGNSDMELCARWMELNAFFPFYRNHNILGAIPQEPYRWQSVIEATKRATNIRYSLLPYMYTLLSMAHSSGDSVLRALAWEFPNEPWLADADRQFMLGSAIMVTPVLDQGETSVRGLFPGVGSETVWYDWYNQTVMTNLKPGQSVAIDAPLEHIPVFLRGGSVIPTQEPALTTRDSRKNPYGLIITLDKSGNANGELYLDDGESYDPKAKTWVEFSVAKDTLKIKPSGNYFDPNPLGQVSILGVASRPSSVVLSRQKLGSDAWTYSEKKQLLVLKDLKEYFPHGVWNAWWILTWA